MCVFKSQEHDLFSTEKVLNMIKQMKPAKSVIHHAECNSTGKYSKCGPELSNLQKQEANWAAESCSVW